MLAALQAGLLPPQHQNHHRYHCHRCRPPCLSEQSRAKSGPLGEGEEVHWWISAGRPICRSRRRYLRLLVRAGSILFPILFPGAALGHPSRNYGCAQESRAKMECRHSNIRGSRTRTISTTGRRNPEHRTIKSPLREHRWSPRQCATLSRRSELYHWSTSCRVEPLACISVDSTDTLYMGPYTSQSVTSQSDISGIIDVFSSVGSDDGMATYRVRHGSHSTVGLAGMSVYSGCL